MGNGNIHRGRAGTKGLGIYMKLEMTPIFRRLILLIIGKLKLK